MKPSSLKNIELRDWQKDAFNAWIENNYSGIISVVTGGGKTVFGLYCAFYLFQKQSIDHVFIIVPTRTLQDQWASTIISLFNLKESDINYNWFDLKQINILVNLSAQKIEFSEKVYKRSMAIFDECHRYGIASHQSLLSKNFFSSIGLTATLERKYDDGVKDFLLPLIGNLIFKYDYSKALSDGVISNYEFTNVKTHFNEEESQDYKDLTLAIGQIFQSLETKRKKDPNSGMIPIYEYDLKIALFSRARLVNNTLERVPIATKLIINNHHKKKIVFCESIKQAELISDFCKASGIKTNLYHSKLKKSQRIGNLVSFQKNFSNTLIGCKSLDEGFDVPDIEVGIIVSQSKTTRQRVQRIGRTIRKSPNKGTAHIYTLYTTSEEKEDLVEEMYKNPNIKFNWTKAT